MEDELIEVLAELGYPVYQQGSILPDEEYPSSFFTFWNDASDGQQFYDNEEGQILWAYSLNFYSDDPELVSTELLKAKKLLKGNKWLATGAGYSVGSDEPTHTGRGMTVYYVQDADELEAKLEETTENNDMEVNDNVSSNG